MKISIDEAELCRALAVRLDDPEFQAGIANLANDSFFVAHFLVSVSQGEGLGEAAVGMIGQDELASLIHDLKRQEREERAHKERTIDAARELFPEYFEDGCYRHENALDGRPYYVAVLESNRARLKQRDRYSRLNLYLTTTFGYEVMVVLLYRTVADAIAASALPSHIRERIVSVLESILAEEETHLGILDQHNVLLRTSRKHLSEDARTMLDSLETLGDEDYEHPAAHAVEQVAAMMRRYGNPARQRADIEAGRLPEE